MYYHKILYILYFSRVKTLNLLYGGSFPGNSWQATELAGAHAQHCRQQIGGHCIADSDNKCGAHVFSNKLLGGPGWPRASGAPPRHPPRGGEGPPRGCTARASIRLRRTRKDSEGLGRTRNLDGRTRSAGRCASAHSGQERREPMRRLWVRALRGRRRPAARPPAPRSDRSSCFDSYQNDMNDMVQISTRLSYGL